MPNQAYLRVLYFFRIEPNELLRKSCLKWSFKEILGVGIGKDMSIYAPGMKMQVTTLFILVIFHSSRSHPETMIRASSSGPIVLLEASSALIIVVIFQPSLSILTSIAAWAALVAFRSSSSSSRH
jgi:predicted branched-subunit amino acid permease